MIALHNSTQAFMVLALKGTASFNVCKNKKKFLDAMLSGDDYPDLRMKNFMELYKYIKSDDCMKIGIGSKNFLASIETDYAMKTLNEIRNNFIHFVPSHWSLEISMLPGLCQSVLCVLEFLILESGNIRFYTNYELERASLSKLISEIRKELGKLENEYITGK